MKDRKLLELAAMAYWGSEIGDVCSIRWLEEDQCIGYMHADKQDHNGNDVELCWNPLTDDGDAFRLAVKLRIDIDHGSPLDNSRYVCASCCGIEMVRDAVRAVEEFEDDVGVQRAYATRRAIVRAAAELAKQEVKG